jgi:DNA-binding NarL/FixJ family response regulator
MAERGDARGARMAPALIRIAIVDDHPVVRHGIGALLASQPDIEVVGASGSIDEALEMLDRTSIDVLLLDIRLGTDSGLRLLRDDAPQPADGKRQMSADGKHPMPAVVVLSAYDYPQYAEAALRLGAAGFVIKSAPIEELIDAIRRAAAGGMAFAIRPRAGQGHVSPRELDVIRLVVDGRTNDEVGATLGIGVKTVETHLRRLFERFDVGSRTELAARALRQGWLEIPPQRGR